MKLKRKNGTSKKKHKKNLKSKGSLRKKTILEFNNKRKRRKNQKLSKKQWRKILVS